MAKSYTVPQDLYSKIVQTFDDAVKSGDLIYTPSSNEQDAIDQINYSYSFVPSLGEKPSGDFDKNKEEDQDEEKSSDNQKPFDPFDPPSPPLTVVPTYAENYAVVLNKFSVVPHHFLLVTKKPYSQSAPLTPPDLAASYHLLRAVNKQVTPSGSRYVGFFNCGEASGASVDHRHIQFIKLPENFVPWPDHLAAKHRSSYKDRDAPLALDKAPFFTHFLVPLESSKAVESESEEELEEHLSFRYSTLLARVLTSIRNTDADPADPETLNKYTSAQSQNASKKPSKPSYNLVFTEDWMLAVPRTAPDYIDSEEDVTLSVNAIGVIGLLLAKSQKELDYIKKKGPLDIICGVSIPSIERSEDIDYDY